MLCVEKAADVILLDEKDARRVAQRLGIAVLGTVGMLIWAKRQSLIPSLREQLDTLRTKGHFRLSHFLYEKALQSVGETIL